MARTTGHGGAAGRVPGTARLRLALLATGLVVVTLLLFGLVADAVLARTLRAELDRSLVDRAQLISGRMTSSPGPSGAFAVSRLDVDAITAGGAVAQAALFNGDLVRSANLGPRDLPLTERALQATRRRQQLFETIQVDGIALRVYTTPLLVAGQLIGVLQVAQPVQELNASLTLMRTVLVGAAVGGAGASFLLGWWLPLAVRPPHRREAGAFTPEAFQEAMLARLRARYTRGELTLAEYEADLRRLLLRAPGGAQPPGAGAAPTRPAS